MQKARRHLSMAELRLLVSTWFQDLFHSLIGVLFTFPSRYWFTIGLQGIFSLEGGPPSFEQDFTCPVLLRCHRAAHGFRLQDYHPLWRTFPSASANPLPARVMVLQPHPAHRMVWALPVRSPLLRESRLISFPPGT